MVKLIWLNMLFAVRFTEACKTYHGTLIDASEKISGTNKTCRTR